MRNLILVLFLIFEISFVIIGFILCFLYFKFNFVESLNIIADMSSIKAIIYAIVFIISQNKHLDAHHDNLGEIIMQQNDTLHDNIDNIGEMLSNHLTS